METEGPKTEHGGEQPGTTNNVVPFPRDWLGPREELIPFGNSAVSPAEGDSVAPGAEAFWGGESDPLNAVLPASLPAATAAATGVAGARLRTRAGRMAVGGLIAAVLAAAVLGRILGAPVGGSGPVVGSDVAAAGFFDLAELRGAVGTPVIESSPPAVHHLARHGARPAAPRHRSAVAARTSATSSTAAASSSTTPPVAPAKSTAQTVSSTSASGTTASSSAPTHSSASSHTANVRPGPVGPGAPFGPGQLK